MPEPLRNKKTFRHRLMILAVMVVVAPNVGGAAGLWRISSGGVSGHPRERPEGTELSLPSLSGMFSTIEVEPESEDAIEKSAVAEDPKARKKLPPPMVLGPSPRVRTKDDQAYLPVLGPVEIRMSRSAPVDRYYLVPLSVYEKRAEAEAAAKAALAEKEAADKSKDDAESDATEPKADDTAVAESPATQPAPNPDSDSTTVTVAADAVQPATPDLMSRTGVGSFQLGGLRNDPLFDPSVVLQYFDDKQGGPRAVQGVEVPFVLPNQPQQPLILDGRATYNKSGN